MKKDKVTVRNNITEEKRQLDEKIEKLSVFVIGVAFIGLGKDQKYAINAQLKAMNDYSKALRDRIIDLTSQEAE